MAKGTKTGGKDFEPGTSGNPNGRPPVPEEIKQLRRLNQPGLERRINKWLHKDYDELKRLLEPQSGAKLKTVDRMIIALCLKSGNRGDVTAFNCLIERIAGKVKTTVQISGPEGAPIEVRVANMTEAEVEKRYQELVAKALSKG